MKRRGFLGFLASIPALGAAIERTENPIAKREMLPPHEDCVVSGPSGRKSFAERYGECSGEVTFYSRHMGMFGRFDQ